MKKIICSGLTSLLILIGLSQGTDHKIYASYTFYQKNSLLAQQEQSELPEIVTQGLELYSQGKVGEANELWINNVISLMEFIISLPFFSEQESEQLEEDIERVKQQSSLLIKMTEIIAEEAGSYLGYEVIKFDFPKQRTWVIYLELQHEKSSIFLRFILTRFKEDWAIMNYNFSPNIQDIIPENENSTPK